MAIQSQSSPERTLTQIDYVRLTRMASLLTRNASAAVQEVLETSDLVASREIPASVITMHTQVLLRGEADATLFKATLCYPDAADAARGLISVLSPLGISLLGLQVGDLAVWRTPAGEQRRARIVQVLFQPEASGNYTL